MVGTSTVPTGIPIWGVVKKETVQCKQLHCYITQLWNCTAGRRPSQARQLCSTLPFSGPIHSYLLCSAPAKCLQCFSSSQGKSSLHQRGADLERSACPWYLIGPSLGRGGLQILTVWSESHCPDWAEWSHSEWSVKMLTVI